MLVPLTVSCFSKIQIGFIFLVPDHLGSPGKGPLSGVCVCVCVCVCFNPLRRESLRTGDVYGRKTVMIAVFFATALTRTGCELTFSLR